MRSASAGGASGTPLTTTLGWPGSGRRRGRRRGREGQGGEQRGEQGGRSHGRPGACRSRRGDGGNGRGAASPGMDRAPGLARRLLRHGFRLRARATAPQRGREGAPSIRGSTSASHAGGTSRACRPGRAGGWRAAGGRAGPRRARSGRAGRGGAGGAGRLGGHHRPGRQGDAHPLGRDVPAPRPCRDAPGGAGFARARGGAGRARTRCAHRTARGACLPAPGRPAGEPRGDLDGRGSPLWTLHRVPKVPATGDSGGERHPPRPLDEVPRRARVHLALRRAGDARRARVGPLRQAPGAGLQRDALPPRGLAHRLRVLPPPALRGEPGRGPLCSATWTRACAGPSSTW